MNTPVLPSLVLLIAPAQRPSSDTTVSLVVVPATVSGSDGRCVRGLTGADFLLIDNERPRPVRVDEETSPISLVIAIQSSSISAPALAKIRKIGSLVEPLLILQGGEAAASSPTTSGRTEERGPAP